MKSCNSVILTGICLLVLLPANLAAQSSFKCWTNNEGVRECGNVVPPEFAQKGHQELSTSGILINEQARALTPKELEERAEELARLEEEERIRAEKEREDQILLSTFSNIGEIELVRDDRLNVIQSRISLAESQIDTIKQNLNQRIQAAAMAERNGKAPDEDLLKDIKSLERQIDLKNDYIASRQLDIESTNAEYQEKIDRFKELRGY